jgi:hypothetical protein
MSGGVARIPAFGPAPRDRSDARPGPKAIAGPSGWPGAKLESQESRDESSRTPRSLSLRTKSEQEVGGDRCQAPSLSLPSGFSDAIPSFARFPAVGQRHLTLIVLLQKIILRSRGVRSDGSGMIGFRPSESTPQINRVRGVRARRLIANASRPCGGMNFRDTGSTGSADSLAPQFPSGRIISAIEPENKRLEVTAAKPPVLRCVPSLRALFLPPHASRRSGSVTSPYTFG